MRPRHLSSPPHHNKIPAATPTTTRVKTTETAITVVEEPEVPESPLSLPLRAQAADCLTLSSMITGVYSTAVAFIHGISSPWLHTVSSTTHAMRRWEDSPSICGLGIVVDIWMSTVYATGASLVGSMVRKPRPDEGWFSPSFTTSIPIVLLFVSAVVTITSTLKLPEGGIAMGGHVTWIKSSSTLLPEFWPDITDVNFCPPDGHHCPLHGPSQFPDPLKHHSLVG
mmetsp:Transcript_21997/g.34634  ORF Transcript_21997/g.34634 Transcript_21997/m.34634 type:complete len:225 (+) Transcript_21997:207-881(+)